MRPIFLTLLFFAFSSAFATTATRTEQRQEPTLPRFTQVIDHLSDPRIEALFSLAERITHQPDLGNCEGFAYRVKMQLPPKTNYDSPLNEFMSRISPDGRVYNFGILGAKPASENAISKIATANTSEQSQSLIDSLNAKTNDILNSDSHTFLMAGTAVYSDPKKTDDDMTIRAIVDTDANEFLMFAIGQCR